MTEAVRGLFHDVVTIVRTATERKPLLYLAGNPVSNISFVVLSDREISTVQQDLKAASNQ
jgi:hypothetical protein